MTILTIPQLELLIFLKSPIIPDWVLKDYGYGDGYRSGYGSDIGFGYGDGTGLAFGFGYRNGAGSGYYNP